MGAKLFLHIGRNRTGSTTLQNTWLRHADDLRASGVQYALFGQQGPAGHDLPSFPSHMALAQYVQDHPSPAILVSHEGLCCFQHEFAEAMAIDLAELDTTLIFYVRPYRDWVVSDYVFNVLIGEQAADFDAYLDDLGDRVRFWPALKTWGDAIGWDRVRVRSLHPDDLAGSDLAVDGMAAIGLAPFTHHPAPRDNASPAWISTELIRFLLNDPLEKRASERHKLNEILRAGELIDYQVRVAVSKAELHLDRGSYLTRTQSVNLTDLYNSDLDILAAHTGRKLRPDEGDAAKQRGGRSPTVRDIPRSLLLSLRDELQQTDQIDQLGKALGESRDAILMALDSVVHPSVRTH